MNYAAKRKGTKSVKPMIPQTTIDTVKRVPITSYLQAKGLFPVQKLTTGKNDYAYCSPLSDERTPSFFVSEKENVFNDFSTGEKGDIIRLIRLIERIPFADAVKRLESFIGPLEPLQYTSSEIDRERKRETDVSVTDVRTLQHPALIQYVEQEREIPYAFARSHVSQVHYSRKGKRYFGVGFRNNSGGWAVRTTNFKTHIGFVDITTIPAAGNAVNVFEGFFNYLSALVHYGKYASVNTTIVLNSASNLGLALPLLLNAPVVYCYLDNDKAGAKAVDKLRTAGCNVVDRSTLYRTHNDFNDYIRSM